jgi:hypothetical protein
LRWREPEVLMRPLGGIAHFKMSRLAQEAMLRQQRIDPVLPPGGSMIRGLQANG